ncbi:methyltransferase [Lentzea sp. NPDC005914]|uniref:methyltransferase n=1 Tax=Lentzea sp. NPDC005914 TaxID=3154572 RepID=UPI0033E15341
MGNDTDIRLLREMSGLVTPMALRVAVTLGLPDRLRADHAANSTPTNAPATATDVAAATDADSGATGAATAEAVGADTADPAAETTTVADAAAATTAAPGAADAATTTAPGPATGAGLTTDAAATAPSSNAATIVATPGSTATATVAAPVSTVVAGPAATGPATVDRLAAELDVDPMALELLLGHLVTLGVVDRIDAGYRTTEFGANLCADAGTGLHNLLHHDTAAGRADLAFVDLAHSIRTGEPAYPLRYGRDFWTDLAERPHLREAFDRQMTWRIRQRIPRFVEAFDWARFATIVDVGGGPGDLLAAVLEAHPDTRGHLVDLEAGPARANLARFGDRAGASKGSFFDPLPAGRDAYLLFDILHDWDDDGAGRILARCAEAMTRDAVLVVIEGIRGVGAATEMDLIMLVHFGGRERSIAELEKLAEPHGLVLAGTTKVQGDHSVLEFRKHPI